MNPSAPTPVTPVDADAATVGERLGGPRVPVDDVVVAGLRAVCPQVDTDDQSRLEAGRDWWPLAIAWAVRGEVPARPAAVCRPGSTAEVAGVLAVCHEARVPVTAMAGRSGVCGASVPAFGGVALDMCGLSGVTDVDTTSLLAEVRPGTFGPDLEAALRAEGVTLGHWPQSMDLSTVGGWLACRGAGQYSTRYGKIEDMVSALEVVLADGRIIRTGGGWPARRCRARSHPALRRLGRNVGRDHERAVAGAPRSPGRSPVRLWIFELRRRPGGVPAHLAPRSYPRRAPLVRPHRIGSQLRGARALRAHRVGRS